MASRSAATILAAAAALAGCGAESSDRSVPELRSKVEDQAAEIQGLRKDVTSLKAQVRLLEERAEARPSAGAPAAAPAAPKAAMEEAASPEAPAPLSPSEETVAAFLVTP